MKITSDWHIHSRNSCDEASMAVKDLIAGANAAGITDFGLTDHLHTPYNLGDIAASRKEFIENNPSPRFHFGIEVSCVSQWEIDEIATGKYNNPTYGLRQGGPANGPLAIGLTREDIDKYGIEYVVAGTHWPMYVPITREEMIRSYHMQNMFLATNPLVNIIAHPWWWMGEWKDANGMYTTDHWLDDFHKIPKSMHDEFASAVKEYRKIVEINLGAMLFGAYTDKFKKQYLEYLAGLKSRAVKFSIGSDCHDGLYEVNFEKAAEMIETIGIRDEELWRLPPRKK